MATCLATSSSDEKSCLGAGSAVSGPALDPTALIKSLQAQMASANVLSTITDITKPLAQAISNDWSKQMANQPWYKTLKAAIEADVLQDLSKKT